MRGVLFALAVPLVASLPCTVVAQTVPERAVAARLGGDPAGAVELLRPWLAEHPEDQDARVQLAYALLALGRLDQAESEFRTVLDAAPGYVDAREGLAFVDRRRAGDADRERVTLSIEGAISTLSGDLDDWHELGGALVLPFASGERAELRANWYERFDRRDTELGAFYAQRTGEDTWLRFGASATPAADFRPEFGLFSGLDQRVADGPRSATVIGVDAGFRRFPAQDVWNVSPAVTQYFGTANAYSLTARANVLKAENDDVRLGGSLRGDYAPSERARAFVGAAAGPDTDLGIVTDTWSLFAGGEVPVGEALSLTGSAAREWRDGPADRTEFRLGVKFAL